MKKVILFLLALVSVISLASCKQSGFDPNNGVLRVGLECAYAPFNWTERVKTDTNLPIVGKASSYAEGYDIMMARTIAADLGYELEIYQLEFDGLIMALNDGTIDVIIAGMSPTEKRKESINFTDAYYRSEHVILVKTNSPYANATTFEDLSGATVVGQKGTLYDTLAKQLSEKNSEVEYIRPLSTIGDIIIEMDSEIIDLTILEEPVAKGIVTANSSYKYIKLTSQFDVADEDLDVAIGVRKEDTELLNQLNEALAKISLDQRNEFMQRAIELQSE